MTGEPGIGKTRLMSELAQVATEKGARVVTGRCWEEGGAPPYWPWMQVVRSAGGEFEALVEPSLLLLRFLGDALAESNVLLVASYRETEQRVREQGEAFGELARVGRRSRCGA